MRAPLLYASLTAKPCRGLLFHTLALLIILRGGPAQGASLSAPPATLTSTTMCARVLGTAGFQRAFCAPGAVGATCVGDTARTCTDDGSTLSPRWYQAAINWAKAQGHSRVVLDPGTITISDATKLTWGWPWNGGGFGLHVPAGIHLAGTSLAAPTVINVDHHTTSLSALVYVAGTGAQEGLLTDASVSNLTLVGTTDSGYSQGEQCPGRAATLNSILELDGNEPASPPATPFAQEPHPRRWTVGVQVEHAQATGGPAVSVHHLRIAHLGAGVAYGWNTAQQKEDPSCQTTPGIKISITAAVYIPPILGIAERYACPEGAKLKFLSLRSDAALCQPSACMADGNLPPGACPPPPDLEPGQTVPDRAMCILVEPTTEFGPRRYCTNQPYEFVGNPSARSQVHHNSICDVNVGINIVGGNVDVSKNIVMRAPSDPPRDGVFGLSTDGHLPYSSSTTHTENFVSGFTLGFLTDGSQYTVVEPCTLQRLIGYGAKDFGNYQHVLDLQQFLLDNAQSYYAQTDPLRGFIDHVYVRDNRFYKNPGGITFYRVNWGFVGFNVIDSQLPPTQRKLGVILDNTINSWVYGNTIRDYLSSLEVRGTPEHQSTLGSCYNGNHVYCGVPGCSDWASYPNVFSGSEEVDGTVCNVAYTKKYCADPTSAPSPTFPTGVERQCFTY
ncbi:hypothetical protein [Pyxidicoccus sp. MSG2]|uniref:hypothetical protein n=1 Tax=Pyxidicoccus sp. MSG2 TaxID=2996790 RepID=UPI002271FD34|nr:hypothetical protein [Pyxidicoccus sp. MSG2]MCY1020446.1 hypothetical protein [Pyxidicoccus sp. MSG2]